MAGRKSRIGYGLCLLVVAALLFVFSKAFLLWVFAVMLGLLVLLVLLLRLDARHIRLEFHAARGGQTDRHFPITVSVKRSGPLFAAKYLTADIEVYNTMFDTTQVRHITLPLSGKKPQYTSHLDAELCGETCFRCLRVQIWDVLELFSFRCQPFPESRTIVYPHHMRMQLALSQTAIGTANSDGLMQNRRGNDPTETFDIREYTPGDDIRSIHWKLSCKTDMLIVRQPSDPSQYDVVVLPDLGKTQDGRPVSAADLNGASAALISLGEQLLRQGTAFCLALPTQTGLHLHEIRSIRELHQTLPEWFSLQIQPSIGIGLQLFVSEHLEQYFTRLLIVTAGQQNQPFSGLEKQIGVTILCAADTKTVTYTALSTSCNVVTVPSAPRNEIFRILC